MIRFQGNDNADKNCERLRREIDFTEGQTFEIVPLEQANGGTIIDYVSEDDKKPVKEKTFAKKDKKEVKETKEVTEKEEIKEEKPELDLNILTVAELRDLAKKKEIKGYSKMKKEELIENLK